MLVDNWLLDSNRSRGVLLKLQAPVRREVVLTTDKPWEGKGGAYFTVLQDGPRIRLYYRGFIPERGDASDQQVTCCVESTDGITFARPNLGLYEFQGSKENNIVYMGVEAHNFAPFLDSNPKAKVEERYKAVGGIDSRLFAFSSPDGIRRALRAIPNPRSMPVTVVRENSFIRPLFAIYSLAGNSRSVNCFLPPVCLA